MMRYQNCPACSSIDIENTGKPVSSKADSEFSVLKCAKCELKWCDPMPSKSDLDNYYNSYYETRYSTVDKNPLKTKIRSYLTFRQPRLKIFFNVIKKYSPNKNILDFGCGEADILYIAKKAEWETLGIDYSNELKEKFENDGIEFIHSDNLEDPEIKENSFGCITVKHVVEHLPNLPGFLNSVKKVLTANGILAVKTPSSTSLRAKLGLANWHFVRPMEHFWGFNIHNFKILMESNGFDVLYIKDSLLVDELTCIARVKK